MELVALRNQIEETNALLARLERDLASYPQRSSLVLAVESLTRKRTKLEAEFSAAADRVGMDICRYRIVGIGERRPSVRSISEVLAAFQSAVTLVYDGLVNEPKDRGRVGVEVLEKTEFEFGYTSPGSLVVNLIVPNERMILRDSDLDDAVATVFEMSRAASPAEIRRYTKKVGRAAVRGLYRWVDKHIDSDSGVDVEWRRQLDVRSELILQQQEFRELKKVIGEVIDSHSEEREEELVLTGWLVGADLKTKRFRFQGPEGVEIAGKFDDAISESHAAEIPHRYEVQLTRRTRSRFGTDAIDEEYFLKHLASVMPGASRAS